MSGVVFRAMALGFLRDRGALVMSLALPVAVFLVFAAIFSGASGQSLRIKVAIADETASEESGRLTRALQRDPAIDLVEAVGGTDAVRARVRSGQADVGLVLRRDGRALGDLGGYGPAPVLVVFDPVRAAAAQVIEGLVQRAYFAALPDVALGGVARVLQDGFVTLEPEQEVELARELGRLRRDALEAEAEGRVVSGETESLVERESVVAASQAANHVAYYAGAIAVLFLLFSAAHGALSMLEEHETGILDRLLAGPRGMSAVVGGKAAFLVAQGTVQVMVIFLVAWLVHGVDLPRRLPACLIVTVAAALAAAGLALALTTACSTRRQAQTLANVAILILSALGGSMVPRFFMPPLLQRLGWATPNTWALEAYTAVFWRDAGLSEVLPYVALLAVAGLAGVLLARRLARRYETI